MSKLILFDYNDAYILVKNIPVANTAVPGAATNNEKKKKKKLCSICWLREWSKQCTSR